MKFGNGSTSSHIHFVWQSARRPINLFGGAPDWDPILAEMQVVYR